MLLLLVVVYNCFRVWVSLHPRYDPEPGQPKHTCMSTDTATAMHLCEVNETLGSGSLNLKRWTGFALGRGLAFRHESVLCPALEQMLGPSRPQHS